MILQSSILAASDPCTEKVDMYRISNTVDLLWLKFLVAALFLVMKVIMSCMCWLIVQRLVPCGLCSVDTDIQREPLIIFFKTRVSSFLGFECGMMAMVSLLLGVTLLKNNMLVILLLEYES